MFIVRIKHGEYEKDQHLNKFLNTQLFELSTILNDECIEGFNSLKNYRKI